MPKRPAKSESSTHWSRDISKSLQQIANCLGYIVAHANEMKDKSDADKIPILWSLGFDRNDIASVLGTTAGTVSVRLSDLGLTKRGKDKNGGRNSDDKDRSEAPE